MVTYPGAMSLFSIADIPETILSETRHLHVSSIFLSTGLIKDVHKLFRQAKALGLTTSLDPQWDPEERLDIDSGSHHPSAHSKLSVGLYRRPLFSRTLRATQQLFSFELSVSFRKKLFQYI